MSGNTEQRLKEILRKVKRSAAVDAIRPESDLVTDLELGSAEVMDLLATVEDEFQLEVNEVEAARMRTVGDVIAFVEKRQGSAGK